jgi:hypothetical protein
MPQDQILGTRWRPNRIGLHKSHPMQSAFQRRRRQQALRHRKPA